MSDPKPPSASPGGFRYPPLQPPEIRRPPGPVLTTLAYIVPVVPVIWALNSVLEQRRALDENPFNDFVFMIGMGSLIGGVIGAGILGASFAWIGHSRGERGALLAAWLAPTIAAVLEGLGLACVLLLPL